MSFPSQSSIKRLSIINADNGIEIYQKNYEPSFFLDHDNQLISGFISALIQFSREIVKDDIQELVFSNSQLYVKKFSTVLVVVMTPLGIIQEEVFSILDFLGNLVETNFEPEQLDFASPALLNQIEVLIDEGLESSIEFPEASITKRVQESPKIVLAGLREVGKTTAIRFFFDSWDKEKLHSIRPTVDYSIFHSFIDVLKAEMTIFDLGGQTQYVEQHLQDISKWKNAAAILFMVDMQKPEELQESYEYLSKIISILHLNEEKPFIGLLAHKYDPDKVGSLQINLTTFLKTFKGLFAWPRYSIFLSSIYDDSLYLAFIRTLARIIPRDLLIKILQSAIFFETQNHVWQTISNELSPDSDPDKFWEKIKTLSIPYGEKLANNILQEWLTGKKEIVQPVQELIHVKIDDIAGGMQVDVTLPREGNSFLIVIVIEGLLTGLGNVFGFSRIMRLHVDQKPHFIKASWGLYEF